MARSTRREVWKRARGLCEYCQLPQSCTALPHELDHIRARKHHGATALANLFLACATCNAAKGPNVAGYDPQSGALVPLFHPRRNAWAEHFEWQGPLLVGRTPVGRATIDVLKINEPERVEHRRLLLALGVFSAE